MTLDSGARAALDACLIRATLPPPDAPAQAGLPGVVAMLTSRHGTLYQGAAGTRALGQDQPMGPDAVFTLFSTTKPLTAVCLMQLVEEGCLRLDDPAGDYLPALDTLRVLTGWDEHGQPLTRAPRRRIRIDDLLLHTSGLGYEFFHAEDLRYRKAQGLPAIGTGRPEALATALLHDPGEAWSYGIGLDWLGRLVEAVRGQRLGEVMAERLFAPLGMADTGFALSPAQRQRQVALHRRKPDGSVAALPTGAAEPPPLDMGGQGLYGTVGDYLRFIRMLLDEGAGPHGRVLHPDTVAALHHDGLAALGLSAGPWHSALPGMVRAGEFDPGTPKGWGYSFLINRTATASGRSAGSLMWAGLGNCHFWVDRTRGLGGFWATQLLPFHDAAAVAGFEAFEATAYQQTR